LRSQFAGATSPSWEQLYPGESWFCSAGEKASKRLFRYVAYWELKFEFALQDLSTESSVEVHVVENLGPSFVNTFHKSQAAWTGMRDETLDSFGTLEHLRVNEHGDLVVEVSREESSSLINKLHERQHNNVELEDSLVQQDHTAILYFICENPKTHNDENWHHRDRIWSLPE
jgi:hypothetical protein